MPQGPASFYCPVSMELMSDPVIVATGHTYDRSCIAKWLAQGNRTCPVTGLRLRHLELTPNIALRNAIQVGWACRAGAGMLLAQQGPSCCKGLWAATAPTLWQQVELTVDRWRLSADLRRSGRRRTACSCPTALRPRTAPRSGWTSTSPKTSCRCGRGRQRGWHAVGVRERCVSDSRSAAVQLHGH